MNNMFLFGEETELTVDKGLEFDALSTLWNGFTCRTGRIKVKHGEDNQMIIGNGKIIPLDEADEYTVSVQEDGVAVNGRDKNCLMRGIISFLMSVIQLPPENSEQIFGAECREFHGNFKIHNRMVHICVFPETTFSMFERIMRLCAVLQYTHIIVEFWGMLKYDCLKELAWEHAFEKSEVKKVLDEVRAMGSQPVPMFNHLGHASQCREKYGKHVVLDQNPLKQYLFTPDGWAWNIQSDETKALLRKVRNELYELFGDGEYIHIGCDEAFIYGNGYIDKRIVGEYLGELTHEIVKLGRKPIMWGDMLISTEETGCGWPEYYCAEKNKKDAEIMRKYIASETIIADWQYWVKEAPVKTSAFFEEKGFDTLICPWCDGVNINACVDTAMEINAFGIIETTWHTLSNGMVSLLGCAKRCGLVSPSWAEYVKDESHLATLLRKVTYSKECYEEYGFSKYQTGDMLI